MVWLGGVAWAGLPKKGRCSRPAEEGIQTLKWCGLGGITQERALFPPSRIWKFGLEMVLLGGIELPTSSLPMKCSTTELQQHWSVG